MSNHKNVHSSLYYFILIAQFFGAFPVCGIKSTDPKTLEFKWRSWRVCYTLFTIACSVVSFLLLIYKTKTSVAPTFRFIAPIIMQCLCMLATFSFLQMARMWPSIMRQWNEVDIAMQSYGFTYLSIKMKTACVVIFIVGTVECGYLLITELLWGTNDMDNPWSFVFKSFGGVKLINAVINIIRGVACSAQFFLWHYIAVFIIILSKQLSSRFKQVAEKAEMFSQEKNKNETSWTILRQDHNRLSFLCKIVDNALGNLILISYTLDMFIIVDSTLYLIKKLQYDATMNYVYFAYISIFTASRLFAVSLFAAEVHSESTRPLQTLITLPYNLNNTEVERFILQIKTDEPALSGKGMFRITKQLLLKILTAVVSYELIYYQYN